MLVRRLLSVLLVLIALVACLLAIVSGAGVDHTIEHSLRLESQFKMVAEATEDFRKIRGRLPTAEELSAVVPPADMLGSAVMIASPGFDQCGEKAATYKSLVEPDYLLIAWRGEWWECYAPTKKTSTLSVDVADYTVFGTFGRDRFVFYSIAALCLLLAAYLSVRRGRKDVPYLPDNRL